MTEESILYFEIINSTQEKARELLEESKAKDGLVLIAAQQTKGIGRLDRSWHSPFGGIWMSSIFTRELPSMIIRGLSVRLGLVLSLLIEQEYDIDCKIKWPNDLFFRDKKLGGILIEYSTLGDFLKYLIIGLGLNVNNLSLNFPKELRDITISLREILGKKVSKKRLYMKIIEAQTTLIESLERDNSLEIKNLWRKKSYTYGQTIQVTINEQKIRGIDQGVTSDGELILRIPSGEKKKIVFGDVHLVRKIE